MHAKTLGLKDRPSYTWAEADNRSSIPPSSSGPTTCACAPQSSPNWRGIIFSLGIEWRQQFYTRCSVPALQLMYGASPPRYLSVVKLDASIRDFPIPLALRMPCSAGGVVGTQTKEMIGQRAYVSIQRDFRT